MDALQCEEAICTYAHEPSDRRFVQARACAMYELIKAGLAGITLVTLSHDAAKHVVDP